MYTELEVCVFLIFSRGVANAVAFECCLYSNDCMKDQIFELRIKIWSHD